MLVISCRQSTASALQCRGRLSNGTKLDLLGFSGFRLSGILTIFVSNFRRFFTVAISAMRCLQKKLWFNFTRCSSALCHLHFSLFSINRLTFGLCISPCLLWLSYFLRRTLLRQGDCWRVC